MIFSGMAEMPESLSTLSDAREQLGAVECQSSVLPRRRPFAEAINVGGIWRVNIEKLVAANEANSVDIAVVRAEGKKGR